MEFVIVVLILLILSFFFVQYILPFRKEKLDMSDYILYHPKGTYLLEPKNPNPEENPNYAVKLQVLTADRNPNYLDLITTYKNGKSKMVRTNYTVGNIYTYFNDYSNVLYTMNPKNIWYDLHLDNGLFRALTICMINGEEVIKLMDYQIVKRISLQ